MPDNKFNLGGFISHGVKVSGGTETQSIGDCPFCGREKKFFINKNRGVWDCKSCGLSGNFNQFLKVRAADYEKNLTGKLLSDLSINRGIRPQTFKAWGIGWTGAFFTVPADGNPKRETTDIKRYRLGEKSASTPGGKLSAMTSKELKGSQRAWLVEGEWDGMSLWESLRLMGIDDDVFAVPGANNFPASLTQMLTGKDVIVCYDHDKPGIAGAVKVGKKLGGGIAKNIKWVHWPQDKPDGFDVRDYYKETGNSKLTIDGLMEMLKDKPPVLGDGSEPDPVGPVPVQPLTGTGLSFGKVAEAYKKWLFMPSTECLDVLFGSVIANRIEGDPLWLFLVAPPGGMKSELLMSISNSPRIVATTSITPHALISGANFGAAGDPSLIPKLNNQVLVIKDFTTIMSMNSLAKEEIFGVLRDAYDGKTEKRFGNGIVRSYESKFGIIAGITHVVETLSGNNPLGERFLKYCIPSAPGQGKAAIKRAISNIKVNDKMRSELSDIGKAALDREFSGIPDIPEDMIDRIVALSQWVAMLRNIVSRDKYSGLIHFKPQHEVGTRIAKQLTKLAYGISLFRGLEKVDDGVFETIRRVGLDTCPTKVEGVVSGLVKAGVEWASTNEISELTGFPIETTRYILQDLTLTGVCIKEQGKGRGWALSPKIKRLISELGIY